MKIRILILTLSLVTLHYPVLAFTVRNPVVSLRTVSLLASSSGSNDDETDLSPTNTTTATGSILAPPFHHAAIKTQNIEKAIKFYSLFDFELETKFLAGDVRAAWLRQPDGGVRLELLEVPNYLLGDPLQKGVTYRAVDLVQRPELLGLNHFALDVTASVKANEYESLQEWIDLLNKRSKELFGKTLRIAVAPLEQMIGQHLYELAFIYDSDGSLVEFLYQKKEFEQEMISEWFTSVESSQS